MVEQDTIKLLRECDAGVRMGISAIEDVLDHVRSEEYKKELQHCMDEHKALSKEINQELDKFHDDGKEPNAMAKGMSWMKTNIKLGMEESDNTVADSSIPSLILVFIQDIPFAIAFGSFPSS